ncbi:MAG: hypothetical protein AAB263_18075 [Planctomycetota bacterium]|mgnify:CR=1 FL=1
MYVARPLVLILLALSAMIAGEARTAFFNQQVSSRTISLNQPIRLEMTTRPKVVEGVNIEAAISDAITLGYTAHWRLVGKPSAVIDERSKTLCVSVVLLPRVTGDITLPVLPVSWLNGDQLASFGQVKVESQLLIGNETRPLPAEMEGVGGFPWGCTLADVKDRLPTAIVTVDGERTLVKAQPELDLSFRRGQLVEATLASSDMTIETARASFLARWGSPQIEEAYGMTWIIGWTRINAVSVGDGKGIKLVLAREDLVAAATKAKVSEKVFSILDAGSVNSALSTSVPALPVPTNRGERRQDSVQPTPVAPSPVPNK